LAIGKIVGAQGMKGEVRVYPDSDFPERFEQPGQRWLLHPNGTEPQPIELAAGRYLDGKGLYIVKFAGVKDRTQAEGLRGVQILVPRSDRPPLEAGEFHVLDLVGLQVFDQASQALVGTVVDVLAAGNDLLEVALTHADPETKTAPETKATTVLIPFVEAIVPVVDLAQQRIEITPPAGLINPV
jgi:16S rRNA processing protein RimM